MIVAVIQARMSSSRLPGKVLQDVVGKPMLTRMMSRVQAARFVDHLIVATSENEEDRPILAMCEANGVECFRGSLNDVLDRVHDAVTGLDYQHLVRLTGDCPLIDPHVIDATIAHHLAGAFEYTTNAPLNAETFPDGLDTEVIDRSAFEKTWREAKAVSHREHVTLYVKDNSSRFLTGVYGCRENHSAERWTVDEPADLAFVREVFASLNPEGVAPPFSMWDVLRLLDERPAIRRLNQGIARNEGLQRSREAEYRAES